MTSYSTFPVIHYFTDPLPSSQTLLCEKNDLYMFERKRIGNKIVSSCGEKYGPYLYRNIRNRVLIASWESPTKNKAYYSSSDIDPGDAMIYYKNE